VDRVIECHSPGTHGATRVARSEFDVKSGTTLLAALQKADILPESVIATRGGEMILEDEILKDGDVVRLVAVISGG
jgi:sulfur carrier protein ThiS